MYRRLGQSVLVGAFVAAFAATTASAQSANHEPRRAGDREAAAREAAITAQAPNARLAGLVRRDATLLRKKGIAHLQRIDVGIYCITPQAATGIQPSNAIVMLTPEYYYSRVNEVKVQWAVTGSGCGSGKIGVYTLADENLNGTYRLSNSVAFSIVVP